MSLDVRLVAKKGSDHELKSSIPDLARSRRFGQLRIITHCVEDGVEPNFQCVA